jgi:hypothetical protein
MSNHKKYLIDYQPPFCKSYFLYLDYQKYSITPNNKRDLSILAYFMYGKEYFCKIESQMLIEKIRSLIYKSIKRGGWIKNSRTHQILGCSFKEFKIYIENKFTEGMNWQNRGEWHFDHIYPLSLAKNEKHLIELNHYTNFQPLWAKDNLKKGNRVIN